ncbi:MAG: DNA repair protein RecN [Prevotella sp.]|nr:DNA repair protein RecN [Prevotella sp.]
MLKQLYIRNFTLIDTLDIEFHPGFSVITGETGAGKSIILGAIGLLLGQRADSKTIKQGTEKCVIEAHFDLSSYAMQDFFNQNDIEYDATDCIVRRELTASGKSRAFINDTPAPLSMLKELGEQLIDIHSQHQNLLLSKQDFQLNVVDIIAKDDAKLTKYKEAFAQLQDTERQLSALEEDIARNRQNADFLQFQYDELSGARLVDGEQEELEQKSETMTHAEDIKQALFEAESSLNGDEKGASSQVKDALNALQGISTILPATASLAERLDSCYIELKDIASEVSSLMDDTEFDPSELDAVNNRLDRINELEQKYHCNTVAELIEQRDEIEKKLNAIENSDDMLEEMRQQYAQQKAQCQKRADELTQVRTKAAKEIEKQLCSRLVPLGMPNVRFDIRIDAGTLRRSGQDDIAFLFSANTSTPLQPISQVASGGEVARVMLALKAMISGAVKLPTIIFDEIDTGVSGKIAEKMAEIMQEMGAQERQVISITHLPQIAALGTHHYKVEKSETRMGTISQMHQLSQDDRIREIAQMLSGSDVSEAAINNAKELLKI